MFNKQRCTPPARGHLDAVRVLVENGASVSAEVRKAIRRHRPGACADAEGVTADALRALPVAALEAMAELFSLARGGDVSAAWHRSTVVPLRKAGGGDGCDAWRPLAIASLVARTWEYTVGLPSADSSPQEGKRQVSNPQMD